MKICNHFMPPRMTAVNLTTRTHLEMKRNFHFRNEKPLVIICTTERAKVFLKTAKFWKLVFFVVQHVAIFPFKISISRHCGNHWTATIKMSCKWHYYTAPCAGLLP